MGYISCRSESSIAISNSQTQHAKTNPHKSQHLIQVQHFDYLELESATSGFCDQKLLGRGSHGCVYKAILRSGRLVAVKKASRDLSNEAETEIDILSNLQSPRLVNLLGFTPDPKCRLLVIEFMSNGTLFDVLHLNPRPPSWGKRLRLAIQTAKAIEILHSSVPPIVHRDIKSANVMIDRNFNARLGDFGLSIRCQVDDFHLRSTPPAGTIGYLDPFYLTPDNLSTKTDVFSFGILLLEVISGRKAFDIGHSPHSIVDWAIPLIKKGRFFEIYDPRIGPPKDHYLRKKLAVIAAKCVRSCREQRPTMNGVVECLTGLSKMGSLHLWNAFSNPFNGGFSNPCLILENVCMDEVEGSINKSLMRSSRRVYSDLDRRKNLLGLMTQTSMVMPEFGVDDENFEAQK